MAEKKIEILGTWYFGILHLFSVMYVAWANTLLFIKVHLTSSILILGSDLKGGLTIHKISHRLGKYWGYAYKEWPSFIV